MTIHVKLQISNAIKRKLASQEFNDSVEQAVNRYIQSQRAEIQAEAHLADVGLIEYTVWLAVRRNWIQKIG